MTVAQLVQELRRAPDFQVTKDQMPETLHMLAWGHTVIIRRRIDGLFMWATVERHHETVRGVGEWAKGMG